MKEAWGARRWVQYRMRAFRSHRREARLRAASLKVRAESMRVNAEFAKIERAPT